MAVIADMQKRIFVIARYEAIHTSCRPNCLTAFAKTGRDMAVIADMQKRRQIIKKAKRVSFRLFGTGPCACAGSRVRDYSGRIIL
jgi:hypothetical protein